VSAPCDPPDASAVADARAFGPDYAEELALRDGTRARLRTIRGTDKDRLVSGLARLSPQSRYLRFFTDKDRLTEGELRYLTELDGERHFAIGAIRMDEDGEEGEGLGIGRFVKLAEDPTVAEPALAVVDDAQGLGLGRLLLLRLVAAATERGVKTFRCDFLAINHGMQELLRDVSPEVRFRSAGPVVTAEFRLPCVPADEAIERAPLVGPMFVWMKLVAEQVMELRKTFETQGEQLRRRWQGLQRELGATRGRGER
jgi:GNAT superfamily N-acetyltransferase